MRIACVASIGRRFAQHSRVASLVASIVASLWAQDLWATVACRGRGFTNAVISKALAC
jgi:hypothetical protein